MTVAEFQRQIDLLYGRKDRDRGLEGTFMWFTEEVGELSRALRRGVRGTELNQEFADVFAWLATLASIAGVDLEASARAKYGGGCPRCRATPCACAEPRRAAP
jgi:NTP pyrophosphatase (non-canonical NTP hydrolase)